MRHFYFCIGLLTAIIFNKSGVLPGPEIASPSLDRFTLKEAGENKAGSLHLIAGEDNPITDTPGGAGVIQEPSNFSKEQPSGEHKKSQPGNDSSGTYPHIRSRSFNPKAFNESASPDRKPDNPTAINPDESERSTGGRK